MTEKLTVDNGVRTYTVNGGETLRFNPSDPNLYHRFTELAKSLPELEKEFREKAEALDEGDSGGLLALLDAFDGKLKEKLSWVFGPENDFDRVLGGVNLLAVGKNGKRIVSNVLEALSPILEDGARQHRRETAAQAVEEAKARRAARAE